MSNDYLTGYLPDSESRLKYERKKALRNVAIMAVIIAAFFYVLIKAMGIILRDNAKVHYSPSGITTVTVPAVEKTPDVSTETGSPSSSDMGVDKTIQAPAPVQQSKQVVKEGLDPESNPKTVAVKEPVSTKDTDESQKPINIEELEDLYNKQLSIIIDE